MGNKTVQVEYWARLNHWISNIQARIFVNVTNFSFLFVVPALYGAIFKFRKMHTISIQGIFSISLSVLYFTAYSMENYFGMAACILLIFDRIIATFYIKAFLFGPLPDLSMWQMIMQTNKLQSFYSGISELERQKRRQSNSLSTKINFLAWTIEVRTFLRLSIYIYRVCFILLMRFHICISWRTKEVSLVPKILKFYYRNIYV